MLATYSFASLGKSLLKATAQMHDGLRMPRCLCQLKKNKKTCCKILLCVVLFFLYLLYTLPPLPMPALHFSMGRDPPRTIPVGMESDVSHALCSFRQRYIMEWSGIIVPCSSSCLSTQIFLACFVYLA